MDGFTRIDTVTAFIALDHDGTEGILSAQLVPDMHMPLIGADKERLEALLPVARAIGRATGTRVSLVRFSAREVLIEDINGKGHE